MTTRTDPTVFRHPNHLLRLALLSMVASAGCSHAPQAASSNPVGCRADPVRYDTLRVGADPVYVEPQSAEQDGTGRLATMGRLNYRFMRSSGRWEHRTDSAFIGVVTAPGRAAELIPMPVPGSEADEVSALPLRRGWAVVFSEHTPRTGPTARDSARSLWYGEFDGSRWTMLERIPVPPGADLLAPSASSLARSRRGMAWVVTTRGARPGLVVMERTDGAWHSELVRTHTPRADAVLSRDGDLAIAAIQPDSTMLHDSNSLLLRERPRHWGFASVIRPGAIEPVIRTASTTRFPHSALTWETPSALGSGIRIRARVSSVGAEPHIVTIDTLAGPMTPMEPIHLPGAGWIWATRQDGLTGPEIYLWVLNQNHEIAPLGSLPSPFVGNFRLARWGSGMALLGPIAPDRAFVATLTIELSVRCEAARP